MGWYIIAGIFFLLIVYMVYVNYKAKNIKDVAPSKKIKILDNKNFKTITRSGLVLVDFWAPWCAPCKMVAPTLNKIAEENPGKITIAKLNADQNKPLTQKYNIRSIPTMILFQDGRERKRINGVKPKRVLLKEIGISA
jgi:thioredoxin 1